MGHEVYSKLSDIWDHTIAWIVASPAWYMFTNHFSSFVYSKAVVWVVFLWFLDFICKIVELSYLHKEIDWDIARKGFKKLAIWLVWLLVCDCFRDYGLGIISYPIESAIIIIEGGSVIKTISNISSDDNIKKLGKKVGNQLDNKAMGNWASNPESSTGDSVNPTPYQKTTYHTQGE